MNKVIMMGRVANDLELKTTPNGVSTCSFSIAVDRNFQKKGEERKSDFFNVVVWREKAEFVVRYFSKGKPILVEGEMQTRKYTDKNGNQATWYEIAADNVFFTLSDNTANRGSGGYSAPPISEPPAGYGGGYPSAPAAPASSAPAAPQTGNAPAADFSSSDSDDYPF